MTRKDYVLLSGALRVARPDKQAKGFVQWCHDACAVADALERDNFRFDRGRFLDSCAEGM